MSSHGFEQCRCLLTTFMALAEELGVPLVHEKTEGSAPGVYHPEYWIGFMGTNITLPNGKIREQKTTTFHKFKELVCHFNFVALGRRLCDALTRLNFPHNQTWVSSKIKEVLGAWRDFLEFLVVFSFGGMMWDWKLSSRSTLMLQIVSNLGCTSTNVSVWRTNPTEWVEAGLHRNNRFWSSFQS